MEVAVTHLLSAPYSRCYSIHWVGPNLS